MAVVIAVVVVALIVMVKIKTTSLCTLYSVLGKVVCCSIRYKLRYINIVKGDHLSSEKNKYLKISSFSMLGIYSLDFRVNRLFFEIERANQTFTLLKKQVALLALKVKSNKSESLSSLFWRRATRENRSHHSFKWATRANSSRHSLPKDYTPV